MTGEQGRLRRRVLLGAGGLGALTLAGVGVGVATRRPSPVDTSEIPSYAGWELDFREDFTGPLDESRWGTYGWGEQRVGQGGMGFYRPENCYTADGALHLRIRYANGGWTSAGLSGDPGFAAVRGRWEVRARFPRAVGIGYVFLLYPRDGSWPPEVNFAEGRVNGPVLSATYHWDADNKTDQRHLQQPDMHEWHTYGVVIEEKTLVYTFDGSPWAVMPNDFITDKELWVGFQCGAMDPDGEAKEYETVPGGVPGPDTPADMTIDIGWVAHYRQA